MAAGRAQPGQLPCGWLDFFVDLGRVQLPIARFLFGSGQSALDTVVLGPAGDAKPVVGAEEACGQACGFRAGALRFSGGTRNRDVYS